MDYHRLPRNDIARKNLFITQRHISLMAVYSYYWHQESHDIVQNKVIHGAHYSMN